MGFSVTASQVILIIAAFAAGSVFTGAVLGAVDDVEEGYRSAWRTRETAVHTNITIVDEGKWPNYNRGAERLQVQIENTGPTVLKISGFTYLIDGAYATDLVTRTDVDSDQGTDLVMPGEVLEVWFSPVTQQPAFFKAVTAEGANAYWRG